ncbi:MAG: TonB-dependent receptor [Acidobacteriota bacterium]|nr:TonB-dependent receptor [Acidobacteriota bacterium]
MTWLIPVTIWAQTSQGILSGTVLDQSGAAVQGAKVTATNAATGSSYDTTSGTDGGFRFPSLAIGNYDVTASQTGFGSVTQSNVPITISQTTTISITLNVGNATQTVTVQAEATSIESQSSEVGTAITSKQVVELPLALGGVGAMRSPEAFVFLAPGTAGPGTANSNNGIFISKIGGGQNFGNEILLDGTSMLRSENGSSFDEAAPSVEAIAEFRVLTSTIPAIYGRTTGGVETFTTKSGTNQFHGTGYDILQNEDLNSNSWFNNGYAASCTPQPGCRSQYARPIDKKNNYGGNFGGPVWIPKIYNGKNKTFFFFNWEQYKQNIGGTNESIVPTAAQRGGDFSANLTNTVVGNNPCTGGPIYQGQIFDPTTTRSVNGVTCRDPFPGNKIPTAQLSKVSQNILGFMPPPNIATLSNGDNYALSSSTPLYNTTYTIRIDQSISDKSKIFAMYDSRDNERYTGSGTYILPPPIDPQGWQQSFVTHYGRAGWDYILSPTLLNHISLGYNRTNSLNLSSGAFASRSGNFSWPEKLGLTGISGHQFPIINIGEGVPRISTGNNDDALDNGERFNDTVSWVKGKHNLTMGFDFRNQLFGTYNNVNDTGTYNFNRNQTAGLQNLGLSGNSLASFILGGPNDANAVQQAHAPRWNWQYYGMFIQDDWKITNHLTLNVGLRYDIDLPHQEGFNNTSNFDPNAPNPAANNHPGALVFGTTCTNCNTRWADTKYHDLGPRLGFAYNPNGGKTVFRGGYGVIYSPLQYTDFGGSQVQGYSSTPVFPSPNGFTPAFNWDGGFPPYAHAPLTDPSIVNKGNPNYIQPRFGQPGIIQSWSFQVQQQVSKDMVATAGYVGQRAQNLRSALMNLNNVSINALSLGNALNQPLAGNTLGIGAPYANFFNDWGNNVTVQQAIRPYPQYGYVAMDVLQNIGQSTYNSLQASLERRFSAGLQLQTSFTWSKTITDADSILPGINGGINQIQNPGNLNNEKALSSQDVPYVFTAAPLWELPFGKGRAFLKGGIAGAVLGGWQIGAVLRYQSGTPVTFGCANGIPGWDNCIRFNRNGNVSPLSTNVLNGTFNPFAPGPAGGFESYFAPVCQYSGQAGCAFADPNTIPIAQGSTVTAQQARGGAYYFGNYPRNNGDARNPNYFNEDFSLIRNFHITESIYIQAKGELLNAFNRHIFGVADAAPTGPYDPQFGRITGTTDGFGYAQRVLQLTLRVTF